MKIDQNGNVGIGNGTVTIPTNTRLSITDGHIQSRQTTAPTVAVTVANGIGGASLTGFATDTRGNISMTGFNSSTSNTVITVTFNKTYIAVPVVVVTPSNAAGGSYKYFITASTTGFTLNLNSGTGSPAFNYFIIE
jgi:hypothetical protein